MKNFSPQHGGDTYGLGNILDFSANLHPLGMPPTMKQSLQDAISLCERYPDPFCRDLVTAISQRDQVELHQILCGNGAADLIFRLCQQIQPKKALITAPTFGEYAQALGNCQIQRHFLQAEEDFDLTERILDKITPQLDVMFLCTPNNPTGRVISLDLMKEIAKNCEKNQVFLVIDECFLDLCTHGQAMTALLSNPYVVLLRAFTKSYGIPGLRLGYCLCSNTFFMEKLQKNAQPWSVSTLAQVAGLSACDTPQWPQRGRDIIETQRPRLEESLRHLGAKVWLSQANYILFYLENTPFFRETMLKKGFLIRSCENYPGLGQGYYRIAVKKEEENTQLQKAFQEVSFHGL